MARAAIATPVSDGEPIETLWRCMSAIRAANKFPRRRTEVAFCQTTGLVHIKKATASDGTLPQRGLLLRFARADCPLIALACIRVGQDDPCPH